jgi:outer membrane biosynthesis protein TonB
MRRFFSLAPGLIAALLLHAIVFLLLWFFRPPPPPPNALGTAVPVTIVSTGPTAAPTPAPEPIPVDTAPPATEDQPVDKPDTAPPPPAPAKTKPVEKRPTPTPAKPQKQVVQSKTTAPSTGFDPSKIADSLAKPKAAKAKTPAKPGVSGGAPKRGVTAAQAGVSLNGLAGKVGPLWVINCETPGARDVVANVRFTVKQDGSLLGEPILVSHTGGNDMQFISGAAVSAVKKAAPYSFIDVPAEARGQSINIKFSGKEACKNR